MTYDHHKKAGNQGDIVKHVALLAALETILANSFDRPVFRYADIFAGYAYSPLILGNEWDKGIEKVFGKGEQLKQNPHTKLWYEWYLQGRPHLLGGVYPGSSLIANDVCRLHKKQPCLALWDVSPVVIANLMQTYSKSDHRIHCRPATTASRAVKSSDFLFIDPPGLKSPKSKTNPPWKALRRFLERRSQGQSVLIWLPVKAAPSKKINGRIVNLSPPEEDRASIIARKETEEIGCRTLRVRWASGGHTVGCLLICHASDNVWANIEGAIRHVVAVADWQSQLSEGLLALS